MISARAAGTALAILGLCYAAAMFWLHQAFAPFQGPDRFVGAAILGYCLAGFAVGLGQLALLATGPRPSSRGFAIITAGALIAAALVATTALVIAWARGASGILMVGVLYVLLNSGILGAVSGIVLRATGPATRS